MRVLLLLLPLLVLACDSDGPVGLVDFENGVRAEVTARGVEVENTKEEPIYAVVYGEGALILIDPDGQTIEDPGRAIGPGTVSTFEYDEGGTVRRSDGRYDVYWITIKGEDGDRYVGERGRLELAR